MIRKKTISIVIPCFNEKFNLNETYGRILKIVDKNTGYNFEIIFIDNGSTDSSKLIIRKLTENDKNVKGIFLSRNFGPEASLQAGLDFSTGDAVIPLACDLQDPPKLISDFIKYWERGFDMVLGIYNKNDENHIMHFFRKFYYKLFKAISNIEVKVNSNGYGLFDKKVVTALQSLPEKHRFFRGLAAWVGFNKVYIKYERVKRTKGRSSYNFFSYIRHAERSLFGFSYLVLDIMVYISFFFFFVAFMAIIVYVIYFLFLGNPIKGSVTILVSILFFGAIELLGISVLGKYIQVIVEETKGRPTYIIDKTLNVLNNDSVFK
jgi:dolichol-phosphate mannosyltransferase